MEDQRKHLIDQFVEKLAEQEKPIVRDYIHFPNNEHCLAEVHYFKQQYGTSGTQVSERIEALRREVNCNYASLQQELQQRFPK